MNIRVAENNLSDAFDVFLKTPELDRYLSFNEFKQKLNHESLVLVAYANEQPVGFKVGYPLTKTTFYSWLGGVVPEFRQQRIAQRLLTHQETIVAQRQYKELRVKSMNRFRGMLMLLIQNGYDVIGVENYGNSETERILFKKTLTVGQRG